MSHILLDARLCDDHHRLREMDETWKRLSRSIDNMVDEKAQSFAAADVEDKKSGELFRRLVSSLDSDSSESLSRGEVVRVVSSSLS